MGIRGNIIDWIKILYKNPSSAIIVNNFITEPLKVKRGIRQGCPLSLLLYSICVEGLANLIRNANQIQGVLLPMTEERFKIVQHADDITTSITKNQEFEALNNILKVYSEESGSEINKQKMQGLWVVTWKNRDEIFLC